MLYNSHAIYLSHLKVSNLMSLVKHTWFSTELFSPSKEFLRRGLALIQMAANSSKLV